MSDNQPERKHAPTSVRQIVLMVGGLLIGLGLYSYLSALDDPWGYRQCFGAGSFGVGLVLLVGGKLWPRSAG